jgi:hypothetical protein
MDPRMGTTLISRLGAGLGCLARSSWIPIRGSILSLRRDLSRCICESRASGIRTGDSLDSPAVTAFGEVGIDCSEGAKPFGIQSSTLKWVLELARPYMPLVFHIRASGDSPQSQ